MLNKNSRCCPKEFAYHERLTKEEYEEYHFAPPGNEFEKELIKYIKRDNISQKSFKKLVKIHVLKTYRDLGLFGSIVYDPENANDIDIFGSQKDLWRLHGSFRKYFNVEHQISRRDDSIPSSFYAIHFINIWHGDEFLSTIDLVDKRTMDNLPPADFVETSMVRVWGSSSNRANKMTYLRNINNSVSLVEAFENIKNKKLTPNETKVITFRDIDDNQSPSRHGIKNLLTCIRYWQRSFKLRDRGFDFAHSFQGYQYVVQYEKSDLESIVSCLINQPSLIVMEYLNDCVYSRIGLCAGCSIHLSITKEYPFVVRTHDNRMWHANCIIAIIKQLSEDSRNDRLTAEEKYVYRNFFLEYMKTFLTEDELTIKYVSSRKILGFSSEDDANSE